MKKSGLSGGSGLKAKSGLAKSKGIAKAKSPAKPRSSTIQKVVSKDSRAYEIKKADSAFSKLVRVMAADETGRCKCFTCNHESFWKQGGIECGHFKSRTHMSTRWLLTNAKPQCVQCNQYLGGNLKVYAERLIETYGEHIITELDALSKKTKHLTKDNIVSLRKGIESQLIKERKKKGL